MKAQLKRFSVAGCGAVLLIAAGCGGGGGDSPAPSSTTLSGVASKGPLKGALVTAYGINAAGVVDSTEIAHASTGSTGAYTLNLGSYTGAVQLVVTAPAGATTADEATGTDVTLPSTFKLHANTVVAAPSGSQSQSASITPYTELAHNIATQSAGGITPGNIANANGVVFALIGVDPVAMQPSSMVDATGATDAQKRYALFNAAVSKLASSTPQTADPTTLTCFSGATDLGKKIECATQQIADSVTVNVSSGQTTVNSKLVGLSDALVSIAADGAINKTGTTIASTDSVVKTLDAVETAAASGTETPISGGTTVERTDVAAAKLFFSGLRSNAAALQSDAMSTGIADGVKAFGDSIKGEAAALTVNTLQVARLGDIAQSLWTNYTTGLTASPDSPAISGFPGGCTVFQGAFPTQFGGTGGAGGAPYSGTSTSATAVANAKWVGCSVNSGPLATDGTRRYRQSILFNMAADATLANVPYLAVTRAQYVDTGTGVTYQQNLTPALSGTAGFTTTSGNLTGFSLVGDLPPATTPAGALLAQRYPVNVAGQLTQLASGAFQATLASGTLGSVPVGASEAGLTIDLSPGGASVAVIPEDNTNATQVAAAKIDLAATISDSKGRLTGSLLVDRFSVDSVGDLVPGHAKFSGDVAVVPVVGGTAGAMVSFLSGSLEATNGSTPVVSFSGSLTLPSRPVATLTVSVTETSVDTYTLEGRYVQNGITVAITGSKTAADTAVTFADSTGVSVSVTASVSTANVTVSGRQTAVIDKNAKTINYIDGTFESLI